MNKNLLLLTLFVLHQQAQLFCFQLNPIRIISERKTVYQLWSIWIKTYHKWNTDLDKVEYRIQLFASNLEIIKYDTTGSLGITQFFDLTDDKYCTINLTKSFSQNEIIAEDIPIGTSTNINWVTQRKVTAVKNQGGYDSYWTFSATGAVE